MTTRIPAVEKLATDVKRLGSALQFADALLGALLNLKPLRPLKRVKVPASRPAFRIPPKARRAPKVRRVKRIKAKRAYRKTSPYWKKLAARKAS